MNCKIHSEINQTHANDVTNLALKEELRPEALDFVFDDVRETEEILELVVVLLFTLLRFHLFRLLPRFANVSSTSLSFEHEDGGRSRNGRFIKKINK